MRSFCLLLFFICYCFINVHSQGYCLRLLGIFNESIGGSCFSSPSVDLANCCFQCIVNGVTRCGSLYNYGVVSCSQSNQVLAQAQADCGAPITCQCTTGSNTSELFGTPLPTNSPTSSQNNGGTPTTNAPTNSGEKRLDLLMHITTFLSTFLLYFML